MVDGLADCVAVIEGAFGSLPPPITVRTALAAAPSTEMPAKRRKISLRVIEFIFSPHALSAVTIDNDGVASGAEATRRVISAVFGRVGCTLRKTSGKRTCAPGKTSVEY